MTLEQFITKATLLVDETGYPARHKDNMVHDTLIAGITNDTVHGKIIKKGPNITLTQCLEISCLEMTTQQSLSQMSHTKLSINYVRYDRKRINKGSTFISSQQTFGKFHRSGLLPLNSKPDANGKSANVKFQLTLPTSRICYRCGKGKDPINQKCSAIDATCNKCGKKGHYAVICQKGKGHSHSSKSTHIVKTMNSISTEPDYHMECREPVYMQSHMLQTVYSQHQKIPVKSTLMIEFPISLHYKDLNQKVMLNVDMASDINCISLGTFQRLFPHQPLTKSTLLLKNYGNSPVLIIGKVKAFMHWKGKIFHQEFHITNANSSPNLLSRDASFQMKVLQTCSAATGREIPP